MRTLKHPRANGFRQLRRLALLLVGFYVLVGNPFGGQESLEASPSPAPALADGFSAAQAEGESAAQEAEHAADELAPNDHGIELDAHDLGPGIEDPQGLDHAARGQAERVTPRSPTRVP